MRRSVLVLSMFLAACSTSAAHSGAGRGMAAATPTSAVSSSAATAAAAAATVPRFDHIVIVVLENHGYGQIVGSSAAPYLNSLMRGGVLFTSSYGLTHPSEPNYLALFSGSTHGLTSDACPLSYSGPNLASALRSKGLGFAGYSEGLPAQGSKTCYAGSYGRKHAPWVNFTNVPATANRTLGQWPANYAQLPTVAFVIPNLQHDMHDGTVAAGDSWVHNHLDGYLRWARAHNSLLIVTFDEDETSEGNHIATVFAGAHVRAGQRIARHIDHYTVQRTIEDAYGLQHLGQTTQRTPIVGAWS